MKTYCTFKNIIFLTSISFLLLSFIIYKFITSKVTQETLCEVYVYTYSSFASPIGPGIDLKKLFKEETHCDVHFENIGDARMLVQRLKSELKIKNTVDADVVLGLDQFSVQ